MRDWIDTHYPGTKLAITEYNFGATEHINGAVTQADVLGIFGREGVDLATMWAPADADDPAGFAFRMFRNYDGAGTAGSMFGGNSLQAASGDVDDVSVFASERDADGAMTIVLVNKKTKPLITPLDLTLDIDASAEVYTYDASDLSRIVRGDDLSIVDGVAEMTLPGYSITLIEIPATVDPPGDFVIVTTTADSGPGSLRDAILFANETPGVQTVMFSLDAAGPQVIELASRLPAISDTIVIDGTSQPGYTGVPVITIDGNDLSGDGLQVNADGSIVKGLAIGGFRGDGIQVTSATSVAISDSYIGLSSDGTVLANGRGIRLVSSFETSIDGNVISGNRYAGVVTSGDGVQANVLTGNSIGTDPSGIDAVPNGRQGVLLMSDGNRIGGPAASDANVISGNRYGVFVSDGSGNSIVGNTIGLNAAGESIGEQLHGVRIANGADNVVAENVISGNASFDVQIRGVGSSGNQVTGNLIGTDPTGNAAGFGGQFGVRIQSEATGNLVHDNTIASHSSHEVSLVASTVGGNTITGNRIGTDATGTARIDGGYVAILIATPGNVIGGSSPDDANVITGSVHGIVLRTETATGNTVSGNFIGVDQSESTDTFGMSTGIQIRMSGAGNDIGPGNVIAFNGTGIRLAGSGNGNRITGNPIYSNMRLGIDLGRAGATANDSGDVDSGENNLQNSPDLLEVQDLGTSLRVTLTIDSTTASSAFPIVVELFAADAAGQGRTFLGSVVYTEADLAAGQKTFDLDVTALGTTPASIVATATDAEGNTSEFSAAADVSGPAAALFASREDFDELDSLFSNSVNSALALV